MKGLAGLVLSLCDLAEAEGRQLRKNIRATGAGCVLAGIGLLFVGAAFAFCVAALYNWLTTILHPAMVMLVLALACLMCAAIILWSAKQCVVKKTAPRKN